MLESSRVAGQLAASQEGLSSMSDDDDDDSAVYGVIRGHMCVINDIFCRCKLIEGAS
jgi:hypothetical protein